MHECGISRPATVLKCLHFYLLQQQPLSQGHLRTAHQLQQGDGLALLCEIGLNVYQAVGEQQRVSGNVNCFDSSTTPLRPRGWPTDYWFTATLLFLMALWRNRLPLLHCFLSGREKQKTIETRVRLHPQLICTDYFLDSCSTSADMVKLVHSDPVGSEWKALNDSE